MSQPLKIKILDVIYKSIDKINEMNEKYTLSKKIDEPLIGPSSNLDSLGLVNLIVNIEQNIEDEFSVSVTLADEKALSQERSPFRTIDSLADYIGLLMSESE